MCKTSIVVNFSGLVQFLTGPSYLANFVSPLFRMTKDKGLSMSGAQFDQRLGTMLLIPFYFSIHDPPNRVKIILLVALIKKKSSSLSFLNLQGTDDVMFHSILTEEGNRNENGQPTTWRAIQNEDTPLQFFNE